MNRKKITTLANEIMFGLLTHDMADDVYIYYNGKRIHADKDGDIITEKDINPQDYFDCPGQEEHILSMEFEGPLCVYFYNHCEAPEWMQHILDLFGVHCVMVDSWNITLCENNSNRLILNNAIETATYNYITRSGVLYRVDIVKDLKNECYEAYIRKADEGTKTLMFGGTFEQNTHDDFIELVQKNVTIYTGEIFED